jgi:hypothetical protein
MMRGMTVEPEELAGMLLGVTASWHEQEGARSSEPVHVWISVERVGTVRLHTPGDGTLEIAVGDPYDPYDMQECGGVSVGEGPDALVERVGQRIEDVSRLRQDPPGMEVGIVLHFREGPVGIANLGDELVIDRWPGDTWKHSHVVEQHRA